MELETPPCPFHFVLVHLVLVHLVLVHLILVHLVVPLVHHVHLVLRLCLSVDCMFTRG